MVSRRVATFHLDLGSPVSLSPRPSAEMEIAACVADVYLSDRATLGFQLIWKLICTGERIPTTVVARGIGQTEALAASSISSALLDAVSFKRRDRYTVRRTRLNAHVEVRRE